MENPTKVIEYKGKLYFDTEFCGEPDKVYEIETDHREILDLLIWMEKTNLSQKKKLFNALNRFYLTNIPQNDMVFEKYFQFILNTDKSLEEIMKEKNNEAPLMSWAQDYKYLLNAINYSYNNILITQPDLHWIDFRNCMLSLKEDSMFIQIIANRDAHNNGKATDEQKKARKQNPEMYVLNIKEETKKDFNKKPTKWELMERELNQFKNK